MSDNNKLLDRLDWIILILVILSVFLGTVGWIQYFKQTGDVIPLDSAIYKSLQLFVFNVDLSRPSLPVLLNITRFLSPALLATAIIRKVINATSKQMGLLKINWFYKKHYIICGLGAVGYKIAEDCISRNTKVVVIEKNPENPRISEIIERKAIVLIGDATDKQLLKNANINKADVIFAVTANDSVNLQISIQARDLAAQAGNQRSGQLRCLVHITETSTINLTYNSRACQEPDQEFYLKPFNINQIAASRALEEYPPDTFYETNKTDSSPVHILIIGMGNIGENMLINFARTAHYICNIPKDDDTETICRRNIIHFVDSHAEKRLNEIKALYPGLDRVVDCRAHPKTTLSFHSNDITQLIKTNDIKLVYLCLEDDIERYTATFMLNQYLLRKRIHAINLMPTKTVCETIAGTRSVAAGEKESDATFVNSFNIIEETCRKEILVNEVLDKLALRINGLYNNNYSAANPDQAARDWAKLPEGFKQSSRYSAGHLGIKIRAMGLDRENPGAGQIKQTLENNPSLFDDLQHIEHIRFVAERFIDGWEPTTEEQNQLDDKALKALKKFKINKTLKPYKMLTAEENEPNKRFIEAIHELV